MSKKFVAITGDLVRSREIKERSKIQSKIKSILEKVNRRFGKVILVKFSITIGDEFQGLITSLKQSYSIIKEINKYLYPLNICFGVGEGKISTKIGKRTTEMDGECFFLSRKALIKAKKRRQSLIYQTNNNSRDIFINTIIMLQDAIKQNWKDLHYQRVWEYEKYGTTEKVAKKKGVSSQAISKALRVAKYSEIKRAEEVIVNSLETTF